MHQKLNKDLEIKILILDVSAHKGCHSPALRQKFINCKNQCNLNNKKGPAGTNKIKNPLLLFTLKVEVKQS